MENGKKTDYREEELHMEQLTERQKAEVLIEALPYIQRFNRKIIVVKYGGSAMVDEHLKYQVIQDVVLLKLVGFKPIIVHGGGAIAKAVHAEKLAFLTDVEGVYRDFQDKSTLISEMTVDEARTFVDGGQLGGGMLPKLQNCVDAIENGVSRVHILDGRIPHCLLLEIFTNQGIGTVMFANGAERYFHAIQ